MPFNYLPDVLAQRKEDAYSPSPFAWLPNVTAERDVPVTAEMRAKGPKSFRNKNRAVNETNKIAGPLGGYAPGADPSERVMNAAGGMDVNAPSRGMMGAMNPNNLGADFARYAGQRVTGAMPGAMAEVANTNAPSGNFAPTSAAGVNASQPGLSPGGYERISPQGMESEPMQGPLPPIYNNKSYSEETGGFDQMADLMGKAAEAQARFNAESGKPAPLSAQQGPLQPQDLMTQESGIRPDPYTDLMGELAPPPDPRLQAQEELRGKSGWWRAGQFGLNLLGGLAAGNPLLGLYAGIEGARGTPFIAQRMAEIAEQQEAKRESAKGRFDIQKQRGTERLGEDRIEASRQRNINLAQSEANRAETAAIRAQSDRERKEAQSKYDMLEYQRRKEEGESQGRLRKTQTELNELKVKNYDAEAKSKMLARVQGPAQFTNQGVYSYNKAEGRMVPIPGGEKLQPSRKGRSGGSGGGGTPGVGKITPNDLKEVGKEAVGRVKQEAAAQFDEDHRGEDWEALKEWPPGTPGSYNDLKSKYVESQAKDTTLTDAAAMAIIKEKRLKGKTGDKGAFPAPPAAQAKPQKITVGIAK